MIFLFSSLSIFSFSSSNILCLNGFYKVFVKSDIWVLLQAVSVHCFPQLPPLCMGNIFLLLCMSYNIFFKPGLFRQHVAVTGYWSSMGFVCFFICLVIWLDYSNQACFTNRVTLLVLLLRRHTLCISPWDANCYDSSL